MYIIVTPPSKHLGCECKWDHPANYETVCITEELERAILTI